MKAAVFKEKKCIEYHEDYPKPEIGPNEALVKTAYCGICGSDIHNFKNQMYQTPLIMGHEFSGEIVELGSEIQDFSKGDKVVGINVKLDISQGNLGGLGIFQNGGFAEFVKVPDKYLFHIPENVSLKEAVMIESFANITRALKLSQIGKNEKIMIIGAGNIGMCFLQALLAEKEPNYIIVIEPHAFLRKKALEFGATEALKPSKSKIKRFSKKKGAPTYIFDCVGNQETISLGISVIERGGTILIEGIHKGKIELPAFMINSKEVGIKGCLGHDREDIMASLDLLKSGRVYPSKLITDTVKLNKLQEVCEEHLQPGERKYIKRVVKL
jgi:2-desacetyl-2-hydroxyethyl bacteriochlorophyllide A dehydrogenase